MKKQLFWFSVPEGEFSRCSNFSNDTSSLDIKEGPPQGSCKNHNETICLCGKKGVGENITVDSLMEQKGKWKYLCGTCRQRTPFSFKIDKKSLSLGGKGKKRPLGEKAKEKIRDKTGQFNTFNFTKTEDGWIRSKVGEYKFVKEGKCELACTRGEAKEACEEAGGYLAQINTKEEAQALKELLKKFVNKTQAWIGGTFSGKGWKWEGGKEIEFSNWGKKQGDGKDKRECMAVDGEGKWWGIHCDLRVSLGRLTPLCEKTK